MSAEQKIVAARSERVWPVDAGPVLHRSRSRLAGARYVLPDAIDFMQGAAGRERRADAAVHRRWDCAGSSVAAATRAIILARPSPRAAGAACDDGNYLSNRPLRYSEHPRTTAAPCARRRSRFDAKVTCYRGRGMWHQLLLDGWQPLGPQSCQPMAE